MGELKDKLLSLPPKKREEVIDNLDDNVALNLIYDWDFWARDKQLPPKKRDWTVWLLLAGRGFG